MIKSDGTLKIMKDSSIGSMRFDSARNRNTGYCSLDSASTYECNVWASTAT